MLAMFGLANRPGGYSKKLLDYLEPLVRTIGQLVTAMRIHQKQHQVEAELSRLSRVASETTNGVVITDTAGNVQWINDGFTRMTGYTLPEPDWQEAWPDTAGSGRRDRSCRHHA